ncbi:hypothetical protein ACHAXR_004756 [Thalassiosira sp. AJA248-18]
MANISSWSKPKAVAAVIVGACLIASVIIDEPSFLWSDGDGGDEAHRLRRTLSSLPSGDDGEDEHQANATLSMYPWAQTLLRPLSTIPEPSRETVLFWHIPKSGGSTAKTLYRALGKSIVISSQPTAILDSQKKGLVQSGQVDIIFSSFPDFAVSHLYDSSHKGRALGLFRHPVDRLISKFFYLQIATWENTYRPEWKDMDILDWVKKHNMDNDHMVKKLAGKIQRDKATEEDLRMAMRTIKQRFVVGLMSEMEESIHRFNIVLGIDESEEKNELVMDKYFGNAVKKTNSNSHPKVEKGSPAWDLLAEQNALDIRLYEYILGLFEEQKEIVDSYRTSLAMDQALKKNLGVFTLV